MRLWKRPTSLAMPSHLDQGLRDLSYAIHPHALRPGNHVQLLVGGREAYPAMLEAIRTARELVHLEVYILRSDRTGRLFCEALAERAHAGVSVRLLYDYVGSFELDPVLVGELREAGVQVIAYRPIAPWRARWGINKRDHRKILVVDGRVGFTGGLNLADEYDAADNGGGGWHDMHARVEGPAVADLARLFRRTWLGAGGASYPLAEEPAEEVAATKSSAFAAVLGNEEFRRRAAIRRAYMHAMRHARRSIGIMNAYFIPDRGMRRVLANAAGRGVSVRVIVPGTSDLKAVQLASQHVYASLLKAGVRIFRWEGKMMHAKTVVVDGVWATVGSYNLDSRSLFHNLEAVLAVVDRSLGARMLEQFDADAGRCQEVTLSTWRQRPTWQKLAEWLCFRFRHWL